MEVQAAASQDCDAWQHMAICWPPSSRAHQRRRGWDDEGEDGVCPGAGRRPDQLTLRAASRLLAVHHERIELAAEAGGVHHEQLQAGPMPASQGTRGVRQPKHRAPCVV